METFVSSSPVAVPRDGGEGVRAVHQAEPVLGKRGIAVEGRALAVDRHVGRRTGSGALNGQGSATGGGGQLVEAIDAEVWIRALLVRN